MALKRRFVLVCCCLPCLALALFIYVTLAVCLSMSPAYNSHLVPVSRSLLLPDHFVAPGAATNASCAARPLGTFWKERVDEGGLWNWLQHLQDRLHNPILRPQLGQRRVRFPVKQQDCAWDAVTAARLLPDFADLPDQMRAFTLSMACRDFPLILDQPQLCDGGLQDQAEAPFLLLAIKSHQMNFERRHVIRRTWGQDGVVKGQRGQRGGLVRRVFLVAADDEMENGIRNRLLELEGATYGDILLWDFRDTLFNLTLKNVLFWKWFSERCHRAHFVFSADDDVFVRTPALIDHLQEEEERRPGKMSDFIMGNVIRFAAPVRWISEFFVPESFYKGLYPVYLAGGGTVYSGTLALRLGRVSQRVHLYPIDCVYLGMCLERLGVVPRHSPAFLTFDFHESEEQSTCAYRTILLVHRRTPVQVLQLWDQVQVQAPPLDCINASIRVELLNDPEPTQTGDL
ncbi:N-acetyllactosaminide beta-1,3-N-acetylglucosaminyltransferase 2-like [Denticeps clupeoides]|uniref:Hexosyltransferase n=1 Tax=Denticeps clupeoides TaxID=299321 RepID=A0AAY4BNG6_9TELE|nr:N-acetyllactosaminide beta-1,3-N-acetylglucosaminyltransferase 2-like [Denticeps clupeoides]